MKRTTSFGLALVLGLLITPATAGAGARGTPTSASSLPAAALPATTIHGVNFLVKSQVDTNFCIEVESGTLGGRTITLQTCSGADTQRWVYSLYASGVNQMLDSQGMCLSVRGHKTGDGLALAVDPCRGDRTEWMTYTSLGQLQLATGCLQVPGAASGAAVSLAPCDSSKQNQLWVGSH